MTQLNNADITMNTYSNGQKLASFAYNLDLPSDGLQTSTAIIRCDNLVWATAGVQLSIFPDPSRVTALLRHRLAEQGSGCWITVEHSLTDARSVTVTAQPAESSSATPGKGRNRVIVNGKPIDVVVEEIKDEELKELKSKRRVRNPALLLDRVGTPQQRIGHRARSSSLQDYDDSLSVRSVTPSLSNVKPDIAPQPTAFYGLEALSTLQSLHMEGRRSEVSEPAADWLILSHAENNVPIRISKRLEARLSAAYPLYRVERTIPNFRAEDVLRLVSSSDISLRSKWDDRLSSIQPIHVYQHGLSSASWTSKSSFPTRSRIAFVATAHGHMLTPAPVSSNNSTSRVMFCAQSSVPLQSVIGLGVKKEGNTIDANRLNPNKLAEYRLFFEGWALETVYTTPDDASEHDEVSIPHCRCEYYTSTDMPSAPGQGAFAASNLRARFARLFQDLEGSLRTLDPSLRVEFPRMGLQVQSILESNQGPSQRWRLESNAKTSSLISCTANQAIFTTSLTTGVSRIQEGKVKVQDAQSNAAPKNATSRPKLMQTATSSSLIRISDTDTGSRSGAFARLVVEHEQVNEAYEIRCALLRTLNANLPLSSAAIQATDDAASRSVRMHVAKTASSSRYTIDLALTDGETALAVETGPQTPASSTPESMPQTTMTDLLIVTVQPRKHPLVIEGRQMPPPKFFQDGKQLAVDSDVLDPHADDEDHEEVRAARLSK